MRRAIETVPKDGKVVILEDDASGTFELAHWSADARAWLQENGERSKITPTYWHPTRRDEYLLQEGDEFLLQKESGSSAPSASVERLFSPLLSDRVAPRQPPAAGDGIALRQVAKAGPVTAARLEARTALAKAQRGPSARRRFAVSSITAAMVAASLIGLYFRAEIAAYVTRYPGEHDTVSVEQKTQVPSQDSQKADSLARDPALHQQAEADRASSQAVSSDAAQLKQPAEGTMAELRQSLRKESDRAEALASELARARRDLETQLALSSKADDEAAQLKQLKAAESATAELRQSLKTEHERAEALSSELARAQRDTETQVALSSKAGDEAAQEKKAAESATAELRQSLQKEHDRAEALTGDLARARRAL